MPYIDKYKKYLNEIPSLADYSREQAVGPVFAYTSNFDVILNWDIDKYNQILEEYLKEEPIVKEGDIIHTMEDFARISSYYLLRGLGGNFDITNIEVCNYLRNKFSSEFSLGGTCAQGAAAIGEMGFPVNMHLTDACKEVCEMLNRKGTTVIEGKKMISVMDGAAKEDPIYHFILQFKKGDTLKVLGREEKIPLSNRLILFYDTVHKEVPIKQDFMDYWNAAVKSPSSYLMSGFDAIIDETIIDQRLKELEPHLQIMRQKHPNTVTYFEGAFYMNSRVKEKVLDCIGKYADILGMNEEELSEQVKRAGYEIDIDQIEEVLVGLDLIRSRFKVAGIVLHTKDYSMYYGDKLEGIDIEKGLTIGNIMSATRARIGKYGNQKDCEETLELALSEKGLRFAEIVENSKQSQSVILVPSKYMEFPKYTIGLGDTFTAGVHTCFIKRG